MTNKDVLLGAFFAYPLRGGVGIGVRGNDCAGTLGGFLEDEDGKCYILSAEHVLNPPDGKDSYNEPVHFAGTSKQSSTDVKGRDNNRSNQKNTATDIIIEQPPSSYHDSMVKSALETLNFYKERKKKIETTINGQNGERNDILGCLMEDLTQAIATAEEYYNNIIGLQPREVGKYLFGLRQNVHLDDQTCGHFVNAGIAELNKCEREEIMQFKDFEDPRNRCPLYGFENNGDFRPNGQIASSEDFGKLLQKERKFSKFGAETGFTCEGDVVEWNSLLISGFTFQSAHEILGPLSYPVGNPSALTRKDQDDVESCDSLPLAQNCFVIVKRRAPFSQGGDSGAIVFDDEGLAWGMILGTICDFSRHDFCVVLPLWVALKALEQKFGIKGLKLWCVKPDDVTEVAHGGANEMENRLLDDKESREFFVKKYFEMAKQLKDMEILMKQQQTKINEQQSRIGEQQTELRNITTENEILTNNIDGDLLHLFTNCVITLSENLENEDEGTNGSLQSSKNYNQKTPHELFKFDDPCNCPSSCGFSVVFFILKKMGFQFCNVKLVMEMQKKAKIEIGNCSSSLDYFVDLGVLEKKKIFSAQITEDYTIESALKDAREKIKHQSRPVLLALEYKNDKLGHCVAIMPDSGKVIDVQNNQYWNPEPEKPISHVHVVNVKENAVKDWIEKCGIHKCEDVP